MRTLTPERPFSSYLTRFEHAIIQSLPTFGPPIWKKKKEKMSNCGRIEIVYKKEKKIGGNSAKKTMDANDPSVGCIREIRRHSFSVFNFCDNSQKIRIQPGRTKNNKQFSSSSIIILAVHVFFQLRLENIN